MASYLLWLTVLAVVLVCVGSDTVFPYRSGVAVSKDQTLLPEQKGLSVVQATIEKISEKCIFENDKQMLRIMALLESNYGIAAHTFRRDFYGGIWQISEAKFNLTRTSSELVPFTSQIQSAFGINWQQVQWSDLTKPLYSGLAARLALQLTVITEQASFGDLFAVPTGQPMIESAIPWGAQAQADLLAKYDLAFGPDSYIQAAFQLRNKSGCNSVGADIAFVLDASGSVQYESFQENLKFVAQVVSSLDVSPSRNRIALIPYSTTSGFYNTEGYYEMVIPAAFHFNTYTSKSQITSHILSTPYIGGGTPTAHALSSIYQSVFTEANGSRKNAGRPQIAILVTDGYSDDFTATVEEALKVHAHGIRMISVGVGNYLNEQELEAVASAPKCQNMYHLQNYAEMADSFALEIEERSCNEPSIFVVPPVDVENPDVLPPPVTVFLEPGQVQHSCFETPTQQGVTLIINGTSGFLSVYLSFVVNRPSDANYNIKYDVRAGEVKTEYLTRKIIASFTGDISLTDVRICLTLESPSRLIARVAPPVISTPVTPLVPINPADKDSTDLVSYPNPVWTETTSSPVSSWPNPDGPDSSDLVPGTGGSADIIVGLTIHNCGAGVIDLIDGQEAVISSSEFVSPASAGGYSKNLNCVWQINTPAWTHLVITAHYFSLAKGAVPVAAQCKNQDRVSFATRLDKIETGGNWCGRKDSGTRLQTTTNQTKITFTTLNNASRSYGFSLHVVAVAKHQLFCEPSQIRLSLGKSYLQKALPLAAYHLRDLTKKQCNATDGGLTVNFETGYGDCGTQITFNDIDNTLLFTNEVSAEYDDRGHSTIARPLSEYIPFRCTLERQVSGTVTNIYSSLRAARLPKPLLEGKIQLQTGLHIFHDYGFDADSEPVFDYYDSSWDRVYIQTSIDNGADSNLLVQAEECWTTPVNDSTHSVKYMFLKDGCPVDDYQETFERHDSEPWQDRFSIESFQFLASSSTDIYFHCKLRICMAGVDEALCHKSCITPRVNLNRAGGSSAGTFFMAIRTVASRPIRLA